MTRPRKVRFRGYPDLTDGLAVAVSGPDFEILTGEVPTEADADPKHPGLYRLPFERTAAGFRAGGLIEVEMTVTPVGR